MNKWSSMCEPNMSTLHVFESTEALNVSIVRAVLIRPMRLNEDGSTFLFEGSELVLVGLARANLGSGLGYHAGRRAGPVCASSCVQPFTSHVLSRHFWSLLPFPNHEKLSVTVFATTTLWRHTDGVYASSRMFTQSPSQIIQSKPIGEGLDGFRNTFRLMCEDIGVSSPSQALEQMRYEGNTA